MLCVKENRHRDGAQGGAFLLKLKIEKERLMSVLGRRAYKCKAPRCK